MAWSQFAWWTRVDGAKPNCRADESKQKYRAFVIRIPEFPLSVLEFDVMVQP